MGRRAAQPKMMNSNASTATVRKQSRGDLNARMSTVALRRSLFVGRCCCRPFTRIIAIV